MSIRNLIFGVNSVTVLYLIRYNSLLQNAIDVVTKWDGYFITKCDRSLLQNASGFSLQNATVLLQNKTILLQNVTVITKCDIYYKLRQYKLSYHFSNNGNRDIVSLQWQWKADFRTLQQSFCKLIKWLTTILGKQDTTEKQYLFRSVEQFHFGDFQLRMYVVPLQKIFTVGNLLLSNSQRNSVELLLKYHWLSSISIFQLLKFQ